MTKTDCRIPEGPSPLEESWETQCVRLSKVILASGTVCQVGSDVLAHERLVLVPGLGLEVGA